MIKGTKILVFVLTISWTSAFSQQLSHQVLVPLAGVISNSQVSYSQTVGETAVQIISCPAYIFTQGFQQPRMIKQTSDDEHTGDDIKVYPNPVSDYVYIELYGETARTFKIDIINITGTIVLTDKRVFYDQFWYKEPYNIQNLIRGFYLIRISTDDRTINRIFKIEKI
ncbi:MAG: T9SS type A sorting domain-containing protein [Bacteroidales bacterium]|nr:T9SS type A sorting domain-containing protein [Bacteroidales bacterium]